MRGAMPAGSVELRDTVEGECTCGVPYPSGSPPPPHLHRIESDWGVIEHPAPRPDRDKIGHLILTTDKVVLGLLTGRLGGGYRAHGDRTFLHTRWPVYSHGNGIPQPDDSELPPTPAQHWTWELHPAHWADPRHNIQGIFLIGRWPD